MTRRVALRRGLVTALVAALLTLVGAGSAAAYEPVEIVHTEQVQVGPYQLTVGFSEWPLRAMQSLDFSFIPEGGIADKRGRMQLIGPNDDGDDDFEPIPRHPRKLDVWGLDVQALPAQGLWTFRFAIDGPRGPGVGELTGLRVLPQPGPPLALSWGISTLPLLLLAAAVAGTWYRVRPGRRRYIWQYR